MRKIYNPLAGRLFGRRCYFAEAQEGGTDGGGSAGGETPTIEELQNQLAEANAARERAEAESERNKAARDTALKKLGEAQKKARSNMSADDEAKARQEESNARIKELETKLRVNDYTKRYMGIGMDERTAEALAELAGETEDADAYFETLTKFYKSAIKHASDEAVQTYLKENPNPNAGNGRQQSETIAVELAKKAASRRAGAGNDIIKHYI